MNFPFTIKRNINTNNIGNLNRMGIVQGTPNQQQQQQQQQPVSLRQAINNPDVPVKMMTWGEPTWLLLHTLAHKVDESRFQEIRLELLNTVFSICANLPCPNCAEHAKMYLTQHQFLNTVQTKTDLKILLFSFHNEVNKRKGLPIFPYSELDNKYNTAVTINIIYNFMNSFVKKSKSIHMIATDNYRERVAGSLKTWFNKYIRYFAT